MKSKTILSRDCKLKVNYTDAKNTCICVSSHALLQYLLLLDENTIKNRTIYLFSEHIPENITVHLPSIKIVIHNGIRKRWDKIKLNLFSRIKYPFLRETNIYAQDHVLISMIGKQHYYLLSDGPRFLTESYKVDCYNRQRAIRSTFMGKIEQFLFGKLSICSMGENTQCDKIFLTQVEDVPVCHQKEICVQSFAELWGLSTPSKREFILNVFNIAENDLRTIGSRPVMFMTQPIVQDYGLSDDEYADLLKKIFEEYGESNIILKLHPRDGFNYKRYFPEVEIFSKPVNMQLLTLLNVLPQKVVTLFSSSIESFSETVEVDWYGVEVHPKIKSHYTGPVIPNRKFNQKSC